MPPLVLVLALVLLALATPAVAAAAPTVVTPPAATNDATPTFSGTAAPEDGPAVTVAVTTTAGAPAGVAEAPVGADGTWSTVLPTPLADGSYTATATGLTGPSAPVAFRVDTVAPALALPALESTAVPVAAGRSFTAARGTAPGDGDVLATLDGAAAPVTTAGGEYTVTAPALDAAAHPLTVVQADDAGNTSTLSGTLQVVDATFTVNPDPPVLGDAVELLADAPADAVTYAWTGVDTGADTRDAGIDAAEAGTVGLTVTAQDGSFDMRSYEILDPRPVVEAPASGAYTGSDGLAVRGTLGPTASTGAEVEVEVSGVEGRIEATVDAATRRFTATVPGPPEPGEYEARAYQTDDEAVMAESEPVRFTVVGLTATSEPVDAARREITFTALPGELPASVALAWDLDGDGTYDDATGPRVTERYAWSQEGEVALRVTHAGIATTTTHLLLPEPVRQRTERPAQNGGGGGGGTQPPLQTPQPFDQDGSSPTPPVAETPRQTTPVTPRPLAPRGPSLLAPFPTVRIAGQLTRTGARVRILAVTAPRNARITVLCRGRSCPVRTYRLRARRTGAHRLRPFERSLRAGTDLRVFVTAGGRIGKYARITVRRGSAPRRSDRCLATDGRRTIACPAP